MSDPVVEKLKTECPHCSKKLLIRAELAGRTLKCPQCAGSFLIGGEFDEEPQPVSLPPARFAEAPPRRPVPPPPVHEDEDDAPPLSAPKPKKKRKKSSRSSAGVGMPAPLASLLAAGGTGLALGLVWYGLAYLAEIEIGWLTIIVGGGCGAAARLGFGSGGFLPALIGGTVAGITVTAARVLAIKHILAAKIAPELAEMIGVAEVFEFMGAKAWVFLLIAIGCGFAAGFKESGE